MPGPKPWRRVPGFDPEARVATALSNRERYRSRCSAPHRRSVNRPISTRSLRASAASATSVTDREAPFELRRYLAEIDGSIVGRAAVKGDPLALSIVQRSGKIVGCGIVSLLHLFNPEIVIVGGGVSNLGDLLFKPMRKAIEDYAIDDTYWKDLVLTTPQLGEDVSIVGAGTLVITRGGVEDVAYIAETLSKEEA